MAETDSRQQMRVGERRASETRSFEKENLSHLSGLASLWGAATARQRLLPDLIVMGDPGGAMALLLGLLGAHHQSSACKTEKGSGFFDDGHRRGIRWYAAHFPTRWSASLQARGAEPHAFEWGSYYLFHPLAAERIARCLPGASVVVLLDDPVERAWAAHQRAVACGRERLGFEEALDCEETRLLGEADRLVAVPGSTSFHHRHHAYVAQGRYAEHLGRLRIVLGEERVHLMDAIRFAADPRRGFQELIDHLAWDEPTDPVRIPEVLPESGRQQPEQQMAPSVRARLRAAFVDSDQQLAAWLDEPPAWQARKWSSI